MNRRGACTCGHGYPREPRAGVSTWTWVPAVPERGMSLWTRVSAGSANRHVHGYMGVCGSRNGSCPWGHGYLREARTGVSTWTWVPAVPETGMSLWTWVSAGSANRHVHGYMDVCGSRNGSCPCGHGVVPERKTVVSTRMCSSNVQLAQP